MTNETLLRDVIAKSGYKINHIATSIGLTYQGFLNKLTNKSEFKMHEMMSLCEVLSIDDATREKIFFNRE